MLLEDYFEFEKTAEYERIRVKGTRIDIECILEPYTAGDSPERIYQSYRHGLNLEQVYATITYYLHNRQEVQAYLERTRAAEDSAYQDYLQKPPSEVMKRLRAIAAQRSGQRTSEARP